jgi:NitT/TauT family transport system permease protein
MTIYGYRIPMFASIVVWCIIWEIIGRLELLLLFPPFTHVLWALGEVVTSRSFAGAAALTLYAYAWGLGLAIVCGIGLGVLMGRVPAADKLLNMWVNVFVSAPLSALVPIIMILFGFGTATIIATVFMFAVWIIALDTRAGVLSVSKSLVEMGRSFGAGGGQILYKIVFLAALPEILAGIRLGVIRGVKGVVIGQLLVAIIGVGALFEMYSRHFLMAHFWALTIILFAFALGLAQLIAMLESRIEYYAGERG